jgi:uncharacterized membrane protein
VLPFFGKEFLKEPLRPAASKNPFGKRRLAFARKWARATVSAKAVKPRHHTTKQESGTAHVLERNIEALLEKREAEEGRLGWEDRVAAAITGFSGSMRSVYFHAVLYGGWIAINLGWLPWIGTFDPTFVVLAMVASVEAIFLSTFILITQNRMMAAADKRADLNLQISLLAEHEVTRLIQMNTRICGRLGIDTSTDPELAELSRDVKPEQVLEAMERREQEFHHAPR